MSLVYIYSKAKSGGRIGAKGRFFEKGKVILRQKRVHGRAIGQMCDRVFIQAPPQSFDR